MTSMVAMVLTIAMVSVLVMMITKMVVMMLQLRDEVGEMLERAVKNYDTREDSQKFMDTIQSAVSVCVLSLIHISEPTRR